MSPPLYLRCACHTAYHFVTVEPDPDIDGAFQVFLVSTKAGSFWHRLKYAWRHVMRMDSLVEADVILTASDASRLASYLTGAAA